MLWHTGARCAAFNACRGWAGAAGPPLVLVDTGRMHALQSLRDAPPVLQAQVLPWSGCSLPVCSGL